MYEAAVLTACLPVAQAQTNTARRRRALNEGRTLKVVTVEDCIQQALQQNLDIQISRYNPLLDLYALNGDYSAYDPAFSFNATHSLNVSPGRYNPSVGLIGQPNEANVDSYTPGLTGTLPSGLTYTLGGTLSEQSVTAQPLSYIANPLLTLSQPVLKNFWIDTPRLTISVAKDQMRIDEQGLRLKIMTVVTSVKTAYFNLIAAREQVLVNVEAVKLADQQVQEDQKRVQVGALAPLDEKLSESTLATDQANLLAAEQALAQAENTLKGLLTAPVDMTPVPTESLVAVPADLNLQASLRRGITQRPEMLQAKLVLDQRNITVKYSKNQVYPEIDLKGSYGRNAVDPSLGQVGSDLLNEKSPSYTYGITITIPLGNISARNALKSARASAEMAMLQLKQQEQSIVLQIDNDVTMVRANLKKVDATHLASQYAESALEAEQKKLENGKSTSFVVLTLQTSLTTARSAEISALANYNISLEQLALDEGGTLERNHIDLKLK